jgi:hypothetical protein
METLVLKPGDEVEFEVEKGTVRLVPTKTIKIPRDQEWFWTPEWQAMEREADQDILTGDYKDFDNLDALLKDLHGNG